MLEKRRTKSHGAKASQNYTQPILDQINWKGLTMWKIQILQTDRTVRSRLWWRYGRSKSWKLQWLRRYIIDKTENNEVVVVRNPSKRLCELRKSFYGDETGEAIWLTHLLTEFNWIAAEPHGQQKRLNIWICFLRYGQTSSFQNAFRTEELKRSTF